ncbi:hypothetical protein BT96DRAFT_1008444 [Gymnopus androsaceus JB14]|uniref:Uncharacterized protein n=1 Tax=Gymnopus androsaceus JB14 TaxID=1447944 RepID=A0A6A4GFG9_9AGAR|nr:hypothetical protein BT96DRAFT_1008444 [Gymnopus androsaceus JB14]
MASCPPRHPKSFPHDKLTFFPTPHRMEVLDTLYNVACAARDDTSDWHPNCQDWSDNVHAEAVALRHMLQAVFSFLDGDIRSVQELMEIIDTDRCNWSIWAYANHVHRNAVSPTSPLPEEEYPPPGLPPLHTWTILHPYLHSSYPNNPESVPPLETDFATFLQNRAGTGIANNTSTPLQTPITPNRAGTSISQDASTPLHSADRAGTTGTASVDARTGSTPLRTSISLKPPSPLRQPLGPQPIPRWNIRTLNPNLSSAKHDTTYRAVHRRRRRNRRPHRNQSSTSSTLNPLKSDSSSPSSNTLNQSPASTSPKPLKSGSLFMPFVNAKQLHSIAATVQHALGYSSRKSLVIIIPGT